MKPSKLYWLKHKAARKKYYADHAARLHVAEHVGKRPDFDWGYRPETDACREYSFCDGVVPLDKEIIR
jgi:hypothetical protein